MRSSRKQAQIARTLSSYSSIYIAQHIYDFIHDLGLFESNFQCYWGAPYPPLVLYVELHSAIPLQGYLSMFRQRQLWWLCWTMTSLQGATMHYNPGHKLHDYQCYIG